MAPTIRIVLAAIVFCSTVASAQPAAHTAQGHNTGYEPAVDQFRTAVNEYVELQRLLANPLANLTHGADPEQAERARHAHRSLIREARALADRPRVFTPFVSAYLQERIQWALRTLPSDHERWPLVYVINKLPELPIELEYRFEGRDLVLLDVEADMVVDLVQDALPAPASEDAGPDESEVYIPESQPLIEGSPCDAHEELEMCWS